MKDHQEQTKRQELLDQLYEEAGRFDPEHPLHAVYTGLYQDYLASQPPTES